MQRENIPTSAPGTMSSLGRVTRAVCDGKSYEYIYDACGDAEREAFQRETFLFPMLVTRAGQITEMGDARGVCARVWSQSMAGRRSRIYNNGRLEVRYGYDAP